MTNEDTKTASEEPKNTALIEQLFSVGAHFGYSKSRRHPSVSPFIFGAKNRVEIFDLEKVSEMLESAKEYARKLGSAGKKVLFVGGKHEAREIVKAQARALGMPYVTGRWIGGTITNFAEIKKRVSRLEDLRDKKEKGEWATKYTKLEQLMFDREITDLEETFGGLVGMKELPSALFVIDTKQEHIAVSEARQKKISIIGLLNSDCDANHADYPIPANDASLQSITFIVNQIVGAYQEGAKNPTKVENKTEGSEATPKENKE